MYRLDIKDAIKRIRSIGNLITLDVESNYAKIANALLSVERGRLDQAVESTKKTLSDWAGEELDNWWGTILSIERLPGIETVEDLIGDGTFVSRIKRYMEAGSKGASLEAVRMAAEAGGGVPFRINKAESRIILTPLENLAPAGRAGALRAVYRLAPARAVIEISDAETLESFRFSNLWSDSFYIGTNPANIRMDGPQWKSENKMIVASADKWGNAAEGTLSPGNGLPSNLIKGGTWHVPYMGFGESTTLALGVDRDVINTISFSIGDGHWDIRVAVGEEIIADDSTHHAGWFTYNKTFDFSTESYYTITITNLAQDVQGLFVRGVYLGAVVTPENKEFFLAVGGEKGKDDNDIVISEASNIENGEEWVCQPRSDQSKSVPMYCQIGGSDQIVSALSFKTRTPGALFQIAHSSEDILDETDYPDLIWTPLPGYFKLVNGRVDVGSFKAKHIRLTFTNLRPMLLKEFYSEIQ